MRLIAHASRELTTLKLQKLRVRLPEDELAAASSTSGPVEPSPCNFEHLLHELIQNKTLSSLSLVDLDLGDHQQPGSFGVPKTQEQLLADILLHNESLVKVDLSGNKLTRLKPLFENLSLNQNNQIQKLVLSRNDCGIEDVNEMLEILEHDSLTDGQS